MCSRFTLKLGDAINLSRRLGIPLGEMADSRDRYNVAPATGVTALRRPPVAREAAAAPATTLHWGFIPAWTRDRTTAGGPLINARAETVAEKPTFRSAWQRGQRCVLPLTGFYEWEKLGRTRLPWLFAPADAEPLAFAGLWDRWQDPRDGAVIESCTVLTTTPNALLARIHDRMPVLLDVEAAQRWLDPNAEPATVAPLLRAYPAERLVATALDPYVNSTAHDDPACLTPRGQAPGAQFDLDF